MREIFLLPANPSVPIVDRFRFSSVQKTIVATAAEVYTGRENTLINQGTN